MSTIPTTTDPALASCAFDKPQRTLGLRRINSTKNRATPLSTRYWPTIAPVPWRFPPRHQSHQPVVVKKNKRILENLDRWLTEFNAGTNKTIDIPLLLIDDEADSASVNTRPLNEKPTEINTRIRPARN